MTINEILVLFFAWCAGMGVGAFFFGGLWWTVRKSLLSTRPALWLLSSLLLRVSVTLAVFYVVITSGPLQGHWAPPLLCLLGFVTARILILRLTRLAAKPDPTAGDAHHAP